MLINRRMPTTLMLSRSTRLRVASDHVVPDNDPVPLVTEMVVGTGPIKTIHSPGVLPPSLTRLTLDQNFEHVIMPRMMLPTIREMKYDTKMPLVRWSMPDQLHTLILGNTFNQPITQNALPPALKVLTFGSSFSLPLFPGCFPASLETLTLSPAFNHPLKPGQLPPALTELTYNTDLQLDIGVLPNTLITLNYGRTYDQDIIPGSLPNSLQRLTFGMMFSRAFTQGVLPNSLTSLTTSVRYDRPFADLCLPPGLRFLTAGASEDRSREAKPIRASDLPVSLTSLCLANTYQHPLTRDTFPATLQTLEIDPYDDQYKSDVFPSQLTKLTFSRFTSSILQPGMLPTSLTWLVFGMHYSRPIRAGVLPRSLTRLSLGYDFTPPSRDVVLSSGIRCLDLYRMRQIQYARMLLRPDETIINITARYRASDMITTDCDLRFKQLNIPMHLDNPVAGYTWNKLVQDSMHYVSVMTRVILARTYHASGNSDESSVHVRMIGMTTALCVLGATRPRQGQLIKIIDLSALKDHSDITLSSTGLSEMNDWIGQ
ncbi:hypothetical protein SAMD00019534_067900 [Acytostelium subglobosum LB1]|uniref:hypothetical protein n=1 Tax=Acytostelium subglobosum LB1 TaxID=1410327 RepID=UPI00064507B9|nr:hypothetical protein SAMD00019534_067900 [Acytostelium subglobosum LB1]GAM23615.1 hypothetical protein SAMD00019534_067900 [Acytostelium subglobosum LB1]|eukprot:XP_012753356.1 hypothetical protein SAMD00019534_067900 [Acytostelium subglobosum LB1]